jgi:hypothetical protein
MIITVPSLSTEAIATTPPTISTRLYASIVAV